MAKQLQVTAPLVILKVKDGTRRHLYAGTPVPDDADTDHVKHLKELGMIGQVEAPAPAKSESKSEDGPPAKSASKADWVAYATDDARGEDKLSQDDAEALTRDRLAEKYLGD